MFVATKFKFKIRLCKGKILEPLMSISYHYLFSSSGKECKGKKKNGRKKGFIMVLNEITDLAPTYPRVQ